MEDEDQALARRANALHAILAEESRADEGEYEDENEGTEEYGDAAD